MKKISKKRKDQETTDNEIIIEKIRQRNTIIIAVLGLIGTALTAYFGYLSNRGLSKNAIPFSTISLTPTVSLTAVATSTQASPATSAPLAPAAAPITQSSPPFVRDADTGYVVVHPACNCTYILASSHPTVLIRLRWGAETAELAEQGADLIMYSLVVDGSPMSEVKNFRKTAILVNEPVLEQDLANTWWVYWDYPIRFDVATRIHSIEVEVKTLTQINNGWNVVPAGFIERFQTTIEFTVIHPVYP